jgi:hypothetical protein
MIYEWAMLDFSWNGLERFLLKPSSTNHDSLPTSLLRADRSGISGTVGDRFSAAVAHALPFAYVTNAAEDTVSVIETTVGWARSIWRDG